MTQPSRTTQTFTPLVGPNANVPSVVHIGSTPIAWGGGGRGYPAAIGLLTVNGIVKVTWAVGDDPNNGTDPIYPGQQTGSYDATGTMTGLIPYDDSATSLDAIAAGSWCFLSQLTS